MYDINTILALRKLVGLKSNSQRSLLNIRAFSNAFRLSTDAGFPLRMKRDAFTQCQLTDVARSSGNSDLLCKTKPWLLPWIDSSAHFISSSSTDTLRTASHLPTSKKVYRVLMNLTVDGSSLAKAHNAYYHDRRYCYKSISSANNGRCFCLLDRHMMDCPTSGAKEIPYVAEFQAFHFW